MIDKYYLNQIERCKKFIYNTDGKIRDYILVDVDNAYDMFTNQLVPIDKICLILRMNGYRGALVYSEQQDNYFIIDIHTKEMVILPAKLDEFIKNAYMGKIIDFYDFVKMHERLYGVFRNNVTSSSNDSIDSTTIEIFKKGGRPLVS